MVGHRRRSEVAAAEVDFTERSFGRWLTKDTLFLCSSVVVTDQRV